jgi:alpha-glucosidase
MEDEPLPRHLIQDPLGKKYWPIFSGRDRSRLPMCWSHDKYAGFSDYKPWLPINQTFKQINLEVERKKSHSLFHFYKELLAFRRESNILRRGKIKVLDTNANVLCYLRTYKEEKLLICLNFTNKKTSLDCTDLKLNKTKVKKIFSTHETSSKLLVEHIHLLPNQGTIYKVL